MAEPRVTASLNLPVIDLTPSVQADSKAAMADHLAEACRHTGSFYMRRHSIPQQLR